MKLPVRNLLALRKASTAVTQAEFVAPATLSSEFFDHIRHEVYGDAKKVDKIIVTVPTTNNNKVSVLVNRNVSTAYHCFNHVSKQFADGAVLVEVIPTVGSAYFGSVNQPIQDQASIQKITFDSPDHVTMANEAYWRSCSFVTAAILKESLSSEIDFRFPGGSIQDGYFAVTVKGLDGKVFTSDELSTINRLGHNFIRDEKPFEVITVPKDIAEENGISGDSLLRIGRHVFSTTGPVIRSTRQIGRFSIFRSSPAKHGDVVVGGVSVPFSQPTASYSWGLIAKNAIQKFSKV